MMEDYVQLVMTCFAMLIAVVLILLMLPFVKSTLEEHTEDLLAEVATESEETTSEVATNIETEASIVEEVDNFMTNIVEVDNSKWVETQIDDSVYEERVNSVKNILLIIGKCVVILVVIVGAIIGIYHIVDNIKSSRYAKEMRLENGTAEISDAFTVISSFCKNNNMSLPTNVMVQIERMSKQDIFWNLFVCDLVRCKTIESLLKDGKSDEYLRYFFAYAHDFVVLKKDDMKDISVNYLRDILKYYKKVTKEVGVIYSMDKVNEDLMLSLTPYDMEIIERVVDKYKDKVNKNNKINLFISPDVALEEKYE